MLERELLLVLLSIRNVSDFVQVVYVIILELIRVQILIMDFELPEFNANSSFRHILLLEKLIF